VQHWESSSLPCGLVATRRFILLPDCAEPSWVTLRVNQPKPLLLVVDGKMRPDVRLSGSALVRGLVVQGSP